MQSLIGNQIDGDAQLGFQGDAVAPWLSWGPYLWADGMNPRCGDGLIYTCEDLSTQDGTHPAAGAREKVKHLLLDFVKTDSTARAWFVAGD